MLNFGNKEFRNLQEQVLKNMKDIQDIEQGATVLADFGIKIVGHVGSIDDLPDPATYDGDYGDAYVVGEETPYNYYIFTRAFEGQEEPSWFNLGQFPVPGPQGETGAQGPIGATPVIGATVGSVSTLNPGQSATASVSVSGTAAQPTMTFNFAIPQGAQGIQGATGPQGPQGPRGLQGEKGEKGEQGGLIDIVGIVATASDLPAPSTLQKLDAAYLVGASPDYELYVQVGETPSTALWTNLGAINEGTVVSVNGTPQTVWEANTKVSVSDGYLVNTLYGQAAGTGNGQTHVPYGTSATANYIVQRDINGQVLVPETPTANNQAASKAYVDANSSVSPIQYAGDLIVGDSYGEESRLAIGSAGQVLTVNSTSNGLEYTDIESVPSYTSSDADKALKVNSTGTALEWGAIGGGGGIAKNFNDSTNIFSQSATPVIGGSGYLADSTFTGFDTIKVLNLKGTVFLSPYFDSGRNPLNITGNNYLTMEGCIFAGKNNSTSRVLGSMSYYNSLVLNGNYQGYGNVLPSNMSGSILYGLATDNSSSGSINLYSSLIGGDSKIRTGNSGTSVQNVIMAGKGLDLFTFRWNDTPDGIAIFGKYNDSSATGNIAGDRLIVGAGTSNSARANCFKAGNNTTDGDYIYIGDTKLTEAQLQALIALLNS